MALHWDEARVIVTCEELSNLGEVPDDAIVVTLKPEEVQEPEAIEAVRNLVLDRTIERRRRVLNDIYELGVSMPEPTLEQTEGCPENIAEAERTLVESLREDTEDESGERVTSDRDWPDTDLPLGEGGLWLGRETGNGVRIFISHVEELVVHN